MDLAIIIGSVIIGIIAFLLIYSGVFRSRASRKSFKVKNEETRKLAGKQRYNKSDWIDTDEFEMNKRYVKRYCSENDFGVFFAFLKSYEGGSIHRKNGKIAGRCYSGKERGDLKGIFYNVVVPNPNISTDKKEEFRGFLLSIGVTGVGDRPDYEERASKLKNKKTDEDEWKRKQVGNVGENIVRDELSKLKKLHYAVINGPVLRVVLEKKEIDHLVVGKTGVFCLETKAFGMTNGVARFAQLFIDPGDRWIIRRDNKNRDIESPTEQICEEKRIIEKILESKSITVHPVLVISNEKMKIKNNISLPYDVVRVDKLVDYIENYPEDINANKRMEILEILDSSRVN